MYLNAKKKIQGDNCPLIESKEKLDEHFSQKNPNPALIYWIDNDKAEKQLQEKLKVSIRCYPDEIFFSYDQKGKALFDPEKEGNLALIAKAY